MSATAVILTGHARTFAHCWKTQREAVYRKLENPTFFVSVVDDADGRAMHDVLVNAYPGKVYFELTQQPEMPEELRERFEAESWHAPWYRSVPVEAIWKQFWHLARGWGMVEANAGTDNFSDDINKFSYFVRIRPDLHFHNWTKPKEVQTGGQRPSDHRTDVAPPPKWFTPAGVYAPWWGSWGGCPDRFAFISGAYSAKQYFNVFHRINELLAEGCAYHPETMLARALERAGIRVHQSMDAEFTTIRTKEALAAGRQHDKPSYSNRDVFNYVNARLAEAGLG